ncbi:FtsX-like permease family protein [Lysinibacillus xylanilyticus]|uniref:FtsX-like permease family protein n=1 Tax=Lysinibacillus xylanilyticus TaxID=582475 RepID=UPI003805C45E
MTLFSIIKKNMQGNFKNYLLYIASMIFSIVIYFTFVSLRYNNHILNLFEDDKKIKDVFDASSAILMIFIAVFIWYSNSFFTKKRKKEIALYSLLGVQKRKIGAILFYENLIMGIIALAIGVGIGAILSKIFAMLLLKLMHLPTIISFSISMNAIINTTFVFGVIILITSFHGYKIIYRFKLIELLQTEHQNERIPKESLSTALLGIILLATSYWVALQPIGSSLWLSLDIWSMYIVLGGSIIGTYFIFNSFTVFLLMGLRKYKKHYYRSINAVSVSQLLSRIQTNAKTLTVIALLSAITLCGIGASYSVYYHNKTLIDKTEPFSFLYETPGNYLDQNIEKMIKTSNHTLEGNARIPLIKVKAELNVKGIMPLDFSKNPGDLNLISASTFQSLSEMTNKNLKVSLQDKEAIALDANKSNTFKTEYTSSEAKLYLSNRNYNLQFVGKIQDNIINDSLHEFTIVVSDEFFSTIANEQKPYILQAFKVSNDKNAKQLTASIQTLLPNKTTLIAKYTAYRAVVEANGLVIFAGLFLGLVFMAATGNVIYFTQLTEALINKKKYTTLRTLGVSKKEIFKSVTKQVAFIFILPVCIGGLHSIIALRILSNALGMDIFIPVLTTMIVYTLIYSIYYLFTVHSYNNIVNK